MDLRAMRYMVVRIVPDPVRNEPVNIGILLQDSNRGQLRFELTPHMHKLRTQVDGTLDDEGIEILVNAARKGILSQKREPLLFERLSKEHNGILQFMGPFGTLTRDIDSEVQRLYNRFVSLDTRGKRSPTRITHKEIKHRTEALFDQYDLRVDSGQRVPGLKDDFRFDFLHRNGALHAIQCLSLDIPPRIARNEAKILTYSVKDIKARFIANNQDPNGFKVTVVVHPPTNPEIRQEGALAILRESADIRDVNTDLVSYVEQLATSH